VQRLPDALTQRPFLGDLGLSCTYCQEQALRRGSVGADALLKLPSRPEPPGGSRVLQHCAKRSLLAPLADRSPIHSHPPRDGSAHDKQRRFSSPAAICLATLIFGNAPNQCHAPGELAAVIAADTARQAESHQGRKDRAPAVGVRFRNSQQFKARRSALGRTGKHSLVLSLMGFDQRTFGRGAGASCRAPPIGGCDVVPMAPFRTIQVRR
jgi:hypothetical protein